MHWVAGADPRDHSDRSRRLDLIDINDARLFQNAQVRCLLGLRNQAAKVRLSSFAKIILLDRAISVGRVEELDGTPVFSLVSGPDRALALATKRFIDIVVSTIGLTIFSPMLAIIAVFATPE